jgi:hypothetical protein
MDRPFAGKVIRLLVLVSGHSARTTSDYPFCQVGMMTGKGKAQGQFCWLELLKNLLPLRGN